MKICVELDLSKTLVSAILMLGKWRKVEYKGLHLICFDCGEYGHRAQSCPKSRPAELSNPPPPQLGVPRFNQTTQPRICTELKRKYEPWMIVQNRWQKTNLISVKISRGQNEVNIGKRSNSKSGPNPRQ